MPGSHGRHAFQTEGAVRPGLQRQDRCVRGADIKSEVRSGWATRMALEKVGRQ